jgi:RND family efflux transporter MFP subunit
VPILRHNRKVVNRGTVVLILSLTALGLSSCSAPDGGGVQGDDSPRPRTVRTSVVARQPLVRSITLTGTLAAEEQVVLGFKVAGRVGEVRVDLGSPVQRGQVVATLVPTDFELRVRQAEAALVQARVRLGLPPSGENASVVAENTALVRQRRAVLEEARLTRERMRTFVERGLSARAELDSAQAAFEVAEGQYEDALEEIRNREGVLAQRQSELELAKQQLLDTELRSPLDGAVRERQVAVGEYRAAGTPVLIVVQTDPLRLQLAVPERDTPDLRPGLPVRVRVERDTSTHEGRIARLGAAIDETNRTLPVEAVIPNRNDALRPGQFATADIIISENESVLVVPRDTIVTFAGVQKVLTVKDGRAHEQRIRTGRRDGDRIEVVEGLDAGDVVIREPGDLVDGLPVQVSDTE